MNCAQRIVFSSDALARIRVRTTLGSHAEAVFALDLLKGHHAVHFNEWRQRVGNGPVAHGTALQLLAGARPGGHELRWLLESRLTPAPDSSSGELTAAKRQLAAAIDEFARAAIWPYWPGIRSYLRAERDARGRVLATGGVDRLLSTLHPKIHWDPPVLWVPADEDRDVHIDGRGLQLVPSMFLHTRPADLLGSGPGSHSPVLIVSSPPDQAAAKAVWGGTSRVPERALAALLGRTRAAVLQELIDSRTTSELAQLLGISAAAASQHTAVLRGAGLITTRRIRNSVMHTITALGAYMLGCHEAETSAEPNGVPS